jgi:hypothetical protein
MGLHLSFEIEMEDLQSFQNQFLTNIDYVKKSMIKVGVVYGFLILVLLMVYFKGLLDLIDAVIPSVFLIVYYIFYIKSIRQRMSNVYKTQLSTMSVKNVIGTHEVTFLDQEFIVKTEFISTTYQYKSIIKKTESNAHLFLFTSAMSAIAIPKKKVENQILDLTDLLDCKIDS